MQRIQNATLSKTTFISFVEQNCQYYLSDECYGSLTGKCIGGEVNGGRLKRESQTAVIYQNPYEFTYPNSGLCWLQEGVPCDYFERRVLPQKGCSAIVEEYIEWCRSIETHEPKRCKCGNKIDSNERKCTTCKASTRKHRNRRFRRDG